MPALEVADLVERCTVWRYYGTTGKGEVTVLQPIERRCKFVRTFNRVGADNSSVVGIDAQVAMDCEVGIGSIVWPGRMSQIPGTADDLAPDDGSELYQVITVKTAKDVKGRTCRWEYGLKRYHKTLPRSVDPTE